MESNLKRLLRFLSLNRSLKAKKRGAILFLAVTAIAVLSVLALGATSSVMQELRLAKFLDDANTCAFTAFSVVELTKILFPLDPASGLATLSLYDLRSRNIPMRDKVIEVSFLDEQSKININSAGRDILQRLPGLEAGGPLLDVLAGAHPKIKEELLFVNGMTPEVYQSIKNLITTYGSGAVNINTALAQELTFLGMDADLIKKIQQYRAGDDGSEGTKDDVLFAGSAAIPAALQSLNLSSVQLTLLNNLIAANQLATSTEFIDLLIVLKRGSVKLRTYLVVLDLTRGKIVSWLEE